MFYTKPKIKPLVLTPSSSKRTIPTSICLYTPVTLDDKRKKLTKFFRKVNSDHRIMTARILEERKQEEGKHHENSDSFKKRYDPRRLTFSHKLIGKVQLPRTIFNIIPQTKELETFRKPTINPLENPISLKPAKEKPECLDKSNPDRKKELLRKSLTCFKHYKNLKLFNYSSSKVIELLPGKPYGLPKSKKFLNACRNRSLETVQKLLNEDKWLAFVFDSSGETGIHWAVKRNSLELVKMLLKAGAFIDSSDYVKVNQVGRTPLFLAVKAQNMEFINFFIANWASLDIRTRAGTGIFDGASKNLVKTILDKYKKRLLTGFFY